MDKVTELLQQLISINSVNPSLVPGAPGENELTRFVAEWLEGLDAEVYWIEPILGRPSVLGRIHGSGGGRSIILYAHLDTVGVEGMESPHSPIVRGNQIFGRGAYDMKGGLAYVKRGVLGRNTPNGSGEKEERR